MNLSAHGSYEQHRKDMREVFGVEGHTIILEWAKFISSDMIDKNDFYKELKSSFPGISMKHRLLFHWAYDAEPWNEELEKKIIEYCEKYDLNIESNIRVLKSKLKSEQARRNRLIEKKTREVFGFAEGGKEGRIYTHFFSSMAYNIHILGDYTSDNTDLEGLCGFDKLIGRIVVELRNLDYANSKSIVNGITQINKKNIDVQKKADLLMAYLKQEVPHFIQKTGNGSLKRKIEGQGYRFINN